MTRPTTGNEIREAFLAFFEGQDHLRMPAASLIPAGDPTLLLTNSGMAQFKAYFAGEAAPPHPRITTSQKCFRTTDIESVGDTTHLTLFEMLGNFSFADYFKAEACRWALEFWRDVLEFSVERLYVTIHTTDDEAEKIWLDLGIPQDRIYRFGDEDNWWGPAGDEGPCGPCSELHYFSGDLDALPEGGDPRIGATWGPNLSDEFVELYNLVFTQFYHHLDGHRTELPGKNIDTGMGLERTAAVAQGVQGVYETDLFQTLIAKASELSDPEYGEDAEVDRALRVMAEHGRSASFLIGDGVVPGNAGRGYVLRRLIRRAMRFGLSIGVQAPFLPHIAEGAAEGMGHHYKELVDHLPFIKRVLETEEAKFTEAVEAGSNLLISLIDSRDAIVQAMSELSAFASPGDAPDLAAAEKLAEELITSRRQACSGRAGGDAVEEVLSMLERTFESVVNEQNASPASAGEQWDAFVSADWKGAITGYESSYLYDTYGFPIEVTEEMASERGLNVDREGFSREMERQRERGRAASKFGGDTAARRVYEQLGVSETPFLGYEPETATYCGSAVLGMIRGDEVVEKASEGEEVQVVLRETPFFAERGGQVGDTGWIAGEKGQFQVRDTRSPYAKIHVHYGTVVSGALEVGDPVEAEVDAERRQRIMRNHTGTHLLHAALRQVLGTHVRQSGSLVAPDRLRFDYTHIAPLSREEILEVQRVVNDRIRANHHVEVEWTTYRDAIERGALAFFGEKYDENWVRTILIDPPWSYELCGGTHCAQTGDIGAFFILSDQSIGSGMRRMEAVTGKGAEEVVSSRLESLDGLTQQLQSPLSEAPQRVATLRQEAERARRRISELEAEVLRASVGGGSDTLASTEAVESNGRSINLQVKRLNAPNVDALRKTGDYLRDRMASGIVVLGSVIEERPMIITMVTKDLVQEGFHAGSIAKAVAQRMGGGGGGRPEMAQAGGRDAGKLSDALDAVREIVSATASEKGERKAASQG